MSEHKATTMVEVEVRGEKATLGDVRAALAVLVEDGISEATKVTLVQYEDRIDEEGVAYRDRKIEGVLRVSASRPAAQPPTTQEQ